MGYWLRSRTVTLSATQPSEASWAVTEEKVLAAIERLVQAADPASLIAFGSRARGSALDSQSNPPMP